jgi:hypothetical protein
MNGDSVKRDIVFRTGESVLLRFAPNKRIIKSKTPVDIETEITDVNSNGAIAVKLLSKDPDAGATFWQWVGSNYIDLRHQALDAERGKKIARKRTSPPHSAPLASLCREHSPLMSVQVGQAV